MSCLILSESKERPLKIEHNTSDLLIVGEKPWFVCIATFIFTMAWAVPGVLLLTMGDWVGVVMALLGVGMGVAAMGVFGERLQIILDVKAGTATLRNRTIFRHKEDVFPLKDLRKADRETTLTSSAADPTKLRYVVGRPTLILDDGSGQGTVRHLITGNYSNSGSAEILVKAINDWQEMRQKA
ncbi:hypothetical protein [Roseovarius sp. EL26]|uniref:hypothetical protein n=1 Tax=Roseovarius sp. EL26 TaxID=2126672 RepID=UPI0020B1076E|nr:hypothetical protein [Roseovarius sp. EL26]